MPLWVDPGKKIPYVLEAERDLPAEKQTTFFFRVMKASDHADFSDVLVFDGDGEDKKVANWSRYRLALLRYTLIGWEGPEAPLFETDEGGYPTDETLSRIPFTIRAELTEAADEANVVKDDDAGKSQPS